MGSGKVRGADQDDVTRSRIAFLDMALSVVNRAVGTERLLVREPDDETLASMQRWLTARRELLETPAI